MAQDRHHSQPPSIPRRTAPRRRPPGEEIGGCPASLDWPAWLRRIERKRRLLHRQRSADSIPVPADYFLRATCSNFKLDRIDTTEREVNDALSHGPAQRRFRSRAAQRIRNHVAILHMIESALRAGRPLRTSDIVRWYTSISSGLSMTGLGGQRMIRLDQLARRINSPHLRLQPALQEIARTHAELLIDPLFPGFNGILSRLLLRYHLGRCGLPAIVLEDSSSTPDLFSEHLLTLQLLIAVDCSYHAMLK